jgi:hypothetical protein
LTIYGRFLTFEYCFSRNMLVVNIVFHCEGVSNPRDGFEVGLIVKLVVEVGILCVRISPLAEAVLALR